MTIDQARLCLLLITDMMVLSSLLRLNTSSLQTLSDQEMLKFFTKATSHSSPTFARPKRVHEAIYSTRINTFDNERYRGVCPSSLSASCDNSDQIF